MARILRARDLKRLTVSLTGDCNLSCGYCYVRNGSSCESGGAMSPELGRIAVRRVMQEYDSVSTIQFFGGEPTLNLPAMEAVVDEVTRLRASSDAQDGPRFGIVTNLTLLSDEVMTFFVKNKIRPAISLDGPKEIHDVLRPYTSGVGSHQTIIENIRRLNDNGLSFTIGATFTRMHLEKGIAVTDLLKYFEGLNAARADVAPVIAKSHPVLDLYGDDRVFSLFLMSLVDAVDYWLDSWPRNGGMIFEHVARILRLLSDTSEREYLCPAGHSSLAVGASGQVYPCHMFIGDKGYELGDVKKDEPLVSFETPLSKSSFCEDCWAAALCVACLGRIKDYCGDLSRLFTPDCELKKAVIREVLDKGMNLRELGTSTPYREASGHRGKLNEVEAQVEAKTRYEPFPSRATPSPAKGDRHV